MASAGFDAKYDYTDWKDGAYTPVALNGESITADGSGTQVDGNALTITAAGTYVLSGSLTDGVILVDASDNAEVRIVLNGANIACSNGAPLFIENADTVTLSLAPGTQNTLTDAADYTYRYYDKDEEEPSAALFSKADLVINGAGTLTVTALFNDGIATNDSLRIVEGDISVTAKDDGIVGKEMVAILTAQLTITSGGDGVKSTNGEETGKGFIAIADGAYEVKAGADGLQAATELYIEGGDFNVTTGGRQRERRTSGATRRFWRHAGRYAPRWRHRGRYASRGRHAARPRAGGRRKLRRRNGQCRDHHRDFFRNYGYADGRRAGCAGDDGANRIRYGHGQL
jgi:hypothetical protein